MKKVDLPTDKISDQKLKLLLKDLENLGHSDLVSKIRDRVCEQLDESYYHKERELKDVQNNYHRIFEDSPVAKLVFDDKVALIEYNSKAEEYLSLMPTTEGERKQPGDILDCIHKDDDVAGCGFGPFCGDCVVRSTVEDTLKTGNSHISVPTQHFFNSNPEDLRYLSISTSRSTFAEKNQIILSVQDETDRKKIAESLKESQVFYESIILSSPVAMAVLKKDGKILTNEGARDILGLESDVDKDGINIFKEFKRTWQLIDENGKVLEEKDIPIIKGLRGITTRGKIFEVIREDKTKRSIQLDGVPIRNEKGDIIGSSVIFPDITDLLKKERIIRESEEKHRNLTENINDAILTLDLRTKKFKDITEPIKNFCDFKAEELIDKEFGFILEPDSYIRVVNILSEELKNDTERDQNRNMKIEVKLRKGDGLVDAEVTAKFIRNNKGVPIEVILTLNDITLRKQAERERELEAEKADKMKGEFMAQISHEIRTPLNVILNYLSLLEEDVNEESDNFKLFEDRILEIVGDELKIRDCEGLKSAITEYISKFKEKYNSNSEEKEMIFRSITRGADRLTRTIEVIVNLAEFNEGIELVKKNLNFNSDILDDLLKKVRYQRMLDIKEKNLIIESHIDDDTKITVDQSLFVPAIKYVIENAVKYNKPDGRVDIRSFEDNGELIIEIEDTGVGIKEVYFQKIFDLFTQEESGYTRSYDGVGLSLIYTKKIVESHGGSITIDSKKHKGTKVTITIPK